MAPKYFSATYFSEGLMACALAGVVSAVSACDNIVALNLPADPIDSVAQADPNEPIELPDPTELVRPDRPEQPFAPSVGRLRRLLSFQYSNSIEAVFGPQAASAAVPPADVPLNGSLAIGSAGLSASPTDIEAYETSAQAVAAAALADASSPVRTMCAPGAVDDAGCLSMIVGNLGRQLFRRSLGADEVAAYVALGQQAGRDTGDFNEGAAFVVRALLQSPNFLYLTELGIDTDPNEAKRLAPTELASRLSYFLTGAPPGSDLLDAAESGDLDSPTGLRLWAETLVAQQGAREALHHFIIERFELDKLQSADRDAALTPALRDAMMQETLRLVDDIVFDRDADARELFTASYTFANDDLAAYYGLPQPGTGAGFGRVELPADSGRAGLLTQGGFLVRFAHPARTSPTLRGKYIREAVLCQAVPPPPPDVIASLPETSDDNMPMTTRDRLQQHITDPSCAACHASMDPLGFAFEGFDQNGRRRTHENGLPVDDSAELDGVVAQGARGFSALLAARGEMASCLVRNLFRHGTGHIEESGEEPILYDVDTAFFESGFRLKEALVSIASSDAFRFVAAP